MEIKGAIAPPNPGIAIDADSMGSSAMTDRRLEAIAADQMLGFH